MRRATGVQNVPLTLGPSETTVRSSLPTNPGRAAGLSRVGFRRCGGTARTQLPGRRVRTRLLALPRGIRENRSRSYSATRSTSWRFTGESRLRENRLANGQRCDRLVFGLLEAECHPERRYASVLSRRRDQSWPVIPGVRGRSVYLHDARNPFPHRLVRPWSGPRSRSSEAPLLAYRTDTSYVAISNAGPDSVSRKKALCILPRIERQCGT